MFTTFEDIKNNPDTSRLHALLLMETANGVPTESNNTIGATDILLNPINPDIAYAAFWGKGVYKTVNANEENPVWTRLTNGIPTTDLSRIALAVSPSSPEIIYALMPNESQEVIDKFYCSKDSGSSWSQTPLPGFQYGEEDYPDSIGPQTHWGIIYNINVAVDPTTPDRVYLSGVSLWKAIRDPT